MQLHFLLSIAIKQLNVTDLLYGTVNITYLFCKLIALGIFQISPHPNPKKNGYSKAFISIYYIITHLLILVLPKLPHIMK